MELYLFLHHWGIYLYFFNLLKSAQFKFIFDFHQFHPEVGVEVGWGRSNNHYMNGGFAPSVAEIHKWAGVCEQHSVSAFCEQNQNLFDPSIHTSFNTTN